MRVALVDADIVVYRVGHTTDEEDERTALNTTRSYLYTILSECVDDAAEHEIVLSGPSSENFRHQYAVTAPYKGNRKKDKPVHYDAIRQLMVDEMGAAMSDGCEADDLISIKAKQWEYLGDTPIISSVDKDFVQCGYTMYNFVKREWYTPTEEEKLKALYWQILTGDRVDNIIGIRGVGDKTARKLLADCSTETELFNACVAIYFEKGIDDAYNRVVENARLLYLQQKPGEIWSPPVQEVYDEVYEE